MDELAPTMWTTPDLDVSAETRELGKQAESDAAVPEKTDGTAEISAAEPREAYGLFHEKCNPSEADKPTASAQPHMTLAQAVAASDAVGVSPVSQSIQQKAAKPSASADALPVGWLVGLSGSGRGKMFPCRPGRNSIGREPQMDISLPEELSVDPIRHAQIIYEPKRRQFFIQAGNGNGLSYLNNELVFTHEELHAYDRIALGEAEFVFLPLCGEFFDWDTNTRGE